MNSETQEMISVSFGIALFGTFMSFILSDVINLGALGVLFLASFGVFVIIGFISIVIMSHRRK